MKKQLIVGAACVFGGLVLNTSAATISWTVGNISGASDVVNTGSTVVALNGSATAVTNTMTANGVDFVSTGEGSSLLTGNFANDTWSGPGDDTGTGTYGEMMSDVDFQSNGTGQITLKTFSGLNIGDDYVFQYWYADDNWQTPNPDRTLTIELGSGTQSGSNVINGEQYATGTFTADANSIDLFVTASHNGTRMTALQLRNVTVVPEPSSTALLGLGGLALILRRRK